MRHWTWLVIVAAISSACSTSEIRIPHSVALVQPDAPYAEAQLLDVGVMLFDAGVPEGEIGQDLLEELLRDGTFVQIRRAEAVMLAVTLTDTLRNSRQWGSVWTTPRFSNAADLNVTAGILQSDGNIVALHVTATDATGRVWLDDDYDLETTAGAYNRQRYPTLDPYQDIFNTIANDLVAIRSELTTGEIANIRTVAELRYANDLSPDAFQGYVEERGNGAYEAVRLPASDDPMVARTRSVRQRERVFFETLDQYYEEFQLEASNSYDGWREFSREDSIRLQEAARAAKLRTALGALTIAMSIAYGSNNNDNLADRLIADAGIYIGGDLLRAGAVRRQERMLYTQSLRELSESFDDDVKPLVVEIQGTQHRLTGTADAQYEEWRRLLQQLFISETGFVPEDISVYAEPAPEPAIAPAAAPGLAPATEAGVAPAAGTEAAPAAGTEASPAAGTEASPAAEVQLVPAAEAPASETPAAPNSVSNPAPGTDAQEATNDAGGGKEADA
jgi:hypothetical protein